MRKMKPSEALKICKVVQKMQCFLSEIFPFKNISAESASQFLLCFLRVCNTRVPFLCVIYRSKELLSLFNHLIYFGECKGNQLLPFPILTPIYLSNFSYLPSSLQRDCMHSSSDWSPDTSPPIFPPS